VAVLPEEGKEKRRQREREKRIPRSPSVATGPLVGGCTRERVMKYINRTGCRGALQTIHGDTGACRQVGGTRFLSNACPRERKRAAHSASRQGTHRSHHRLKKALFRVPHVYLAREGTSTRVHLRVPRGDCLGSFEIARISRCNYVGRHEKRWLATN
jgi:hypothetical protein